MITGAGQISTVEPVDNQDLSEGWTYAKVGEILTVNYGKGLTEAARIPGEVPVYGSNGMVGKHNVALTRGLTIILGRKGTVGAVHLSTHPCWPIDTTYFIDEFHGLDPTYLTYVLRSLDLAELDTSTAIPGLSRDDLYAQRIPLAPLAEQKRIVAKVEALLARVNAARERLSKVPAIIKRFRQAVLAAACSGQLTEDWREAYPDVEPAQALLKRVGEKKRQLWLEEILRKGHNPNTSKLPAAAKPNPAFDVDAPERWAVTSMDELTSRITSGSRDWKRYYCDDGPGTFIMAQNVRPLCFDQSYRLGVAVPENDRDRERSQVKQEDILVTIVGANTGDVCRISEPVAQHYVCQSVALMRPAFEEISPFLELFLNSPQHGQAQYQDWIYGEGRPHLSFDHLRATAVLLPPLPEQHEIVRRVEALFKLADTIEKRVATATVRAEKLTQAILAKAFRGELVPTEAELARRESRSSEPASTLLARIKAERESLK